MPKSPKSFNDGEANESVHPCVALFRLKALCGHWLINLYCIPLGKGEKLKVIKHCKKSHPPRKLMKVSLIGMQSEHRVFHRCSEEDRRQPVLSNWQTTEGGYWSLIRERWRSMMGISWGSRARHWWTSFLRGKTAWKLSFVWMLKMMLHSSSPPQQTLGGKASWSPTPIFQKWGCFKSIVHILNRLFKPSMCFKK